GFNRFRAGISEKQRIKARGQDRAQLIDQFEERFMHDGRVLPVNEGADLLLRRLHHARMAVAGAGHADSRGEVEIPGAIDIEKLAPAAIVNGDWGGLLEQWR